MANAAQRAALAAELATDPLGRGYAGMTDQQAADDLNTEYRSRYLEADNLSTGPFNL